MTHSSAAAAATRSLPLCSPCQSFRRTHDLGFPVFHAQGLTKRVDFGCPDPTSPPRSERAVGAWTCTVFDREALRASAQTTVFLASTPPELLRPRASPISPAGASSSESECGAFSAPGDPGATVLCGEGRIGGLLTGGSGQSRQTLPASRTGLPFTGS